VLVGSMFSSSAPDRYIRPVITFVIFASGLKYVGVGTTELGWILVTTLLAGFAGWVGIKQPWRGTSAAAAAGPDSRSTAPAAEGMVVGGRFASGSLEE
jgi:hypothetical protein